MSHHPQILLRELAAGHKDFLLGLSGAGPSRHSALFALPEIPRATAIAPDLESAGLKRAIAGQISDAYLKSADRLRQICQTSLYSAWTKASAKGPLDREEAQAMTKAWIAAYSQQTRCWAENAVSRAQDLVAKAQTDSAAFLQNDQKPVFNYEYTPLLEQYFQYNAYPSAPDRAVLARKSMMTPRQIEVWFQNHRNRAKKEGKVLRKLADEPLPPELSLRSLEEKMPYFTIPIDERKSPGKSGPIGNDLSDMEQAPTATPLPVSSLNSGIVEFNPLNPLRSPQAFPMIYVHRDVDCFSTEPRSYKFPPPTWDRKPATCSHLRSQIDMNSLILEFNQKLHLRASDSKVPCSHVSQPWCAGRYIPWCPAPHPALIRSTRVSLTYPPVECLPTVPTNISCPRAFRFPSASALSTTLVPTQPRSASSSCKKVAGLPRRIPKHKSTAHAHESPASSETSEESILSSHNSRISSFSSNISSRRPSSSSGSSSSSSPTTPIMSFSSLPEDPDLSAVSVSGVDVDYADDLVDNASEIASPVEKSFALSTSVQEKQRFAFGFGMPAAHLSHNHPHWTPNSLS